MSRLVFVIAAHADDEALGCAGAIARHAASGDRVEIMFMTDGVGSRGAMDGATQERRAMALAAARVLGVSHTHFENFVDNEMDGTPLLNIVRSIEAFVAQRSPDVVYTHHLGDLNVDHRITASAVLTCFRPQPGRARPTILSFEVPSSTEWQAPASHLSFTPNWFEDISDFTDTKRRVLEVYAREMRPAPHARAIASVMALAQWRGASVGVAAAEAFVLLRRIS